ncbi:hypothetical protein ACFLU6_05525 [Acidobacteriota bacterium]
MTDKDLSERYQALLAVNSQLHEEAIETIPRWAMQQGAKRLGITFSGSTLKFKTGWEVHLLLQYVLYELPYRDETIISSYLATISEGDDKDRRAFVKNLKRSFASLFEITGISGEQLNLIDLLTDGKEYLLVNGGLSKTAHAGMLLFTRLVPTDEFCMTTGASMPFLGKEKDTLVRLLSESKAGKGPRETSPVRFRKCFGHFRTSGEPTDHWVEDKS